MKNLDVKSIILVIFMGQSNMAGRGDASKSVQCGGYAGKEFRAISDPVKFYPIEEPFGYYENRLGEIDDGKRKRGSMVSAFVDTYYQRTGRSIVAVSASIGGTASNQWVNQFVNDAATRLEKAKAFLNAHDIIPEHIYMVWCQGETDGDNQVSADEYMDNFNKIFKEMQTKGIEKCFMIQIGHFNYIDYPQGDGVRSGEQLDMQYQIIRKAQENICRENDDIIMAASFDSFITLMRDQYHYYHEAYNQVGAFASETVARVEASF